MYDDPTEEIGVSLPTSVNERASDTTNKITGPSFIDKGPLIDWSTDYNLYNCFKMWKQRCELLPGRWRKLNKKSNASIYYIMSADGQKKLENYWMRFEHFVKPHSNELIAM